MAIKVVPRRKYFSKQNTVHSDYVRLALEERQTRLLQDFLVFLGNKDPAQGLYMLGRDSISELHLHSQTSLGITEGLRDNNYRVRNTKQQCRSGRNCGRGSENGQNI